MNFSLTHFRLSAVVFFSYIAALGLQATPPDIKLTGARISPRLAVTLKAGPRLVDGGGKQNYDTVGVIGKTKTFTIKNTGTAILKDISISKTGNQKNDFIITIPVKTSLAPGASTTFKVSFKPKGAGIRTAVVHIKSNATKKNPFDIKLEGLSQNAAPVPVYYTELTDVASPFDWLFFGNGGKTVVARKVERNFTGIVSYCNGYLVIDDVSGQNHEVVYSKDGLLTKLVFSGKGFIEYNDHNITQSTVTVTFVDQSGSIIGKKEGVKVGPIFFGNPLMGSLMSNAPLAAKARNTQFPAFANEPPKPGITDTILSVSKNAIDISVDVLQQGASTGWELDPTKFNRAGTLVSIGQIVADMFIKGGVGGNIAAITKIGLDAAACGMMVGTVAAAIETAPVGIPALLLTSYSVVDGLNSCKEAVVGSIKLAKSGNVKPGDYQARMDELFQDAGDPILGDINWGDRANPDIGGLERHHEFFAKVLLAKQCFNLELFAYSELPAPDAKIKKHLELRKLLFIDWLDPKKRYSVDYHIPYYKNQVANCIDDVEFLRSAIARWEDKLTKPIYLPYTREGIQADIDDKKTQLFSSSRLLAQRQNDLILLEKISSDLAKILTAVTNMSVRN